MSKTLLIVDDDPNILDTARDILEDAGYTVLTEGTGAGALKILSSTLIDLALFDFNLPDMQGVELAVQAKKLRPKLVVILLTGEQHVDLRSAQTALAAVLTKPVNPQELINVIRARVDS